MYLTAKNAADFVLEKHCLGLPKKVMYFAFKVRAIVLLYYLYRTYPMMILTVYYTTHYNISTNTYTIYLHVNNMM